VGEIESVFLIDIFPNEVFGGFGVKDEAIEVEEQGVEHGGNFFTTKATR
jgi:hypothetical protein